MASFHTIVAAVDFSDITGEVVETARDLARLNHARLHVIHAVGDPFRSMYTVETGAFDFTDMIRQWTEAAQRTGEPGRKVSDGTGPAHYRRSRGGSGRRNRGIRG